jgi:hypothetical protein
MSTHNASIEPEVDINDDTKEAQVANGLRFLIEILKGEEYCTNYRCVTHGEGIYIKQSFPRDGFTYEVCSGCGASKMHNDFTAQLEKLAQFMEVNF